MTIRDAVALARKELVETSLEDAEFEARQLAAFCLGKRRLYMFEFANAGRCAEKASKLHNAQKKS